jgi:hypothetical protein
MLTAVLAVNAIGSVLCCIARQHLCTTQGPYDTTAFHGSKDAVQAQPLMCLGIICTALVLAMNQVSVSQRL